ncbi:diaminopimelate epimerase [Helicobacter cynogastricus]|uniref:diaminopimelate epimerase n=1 Tax=Helicobacter cynogastricus TaxID=329937 RepID=UPI000CF0BD0C|nr:diaminopimelate epimerase [Helicobacter cynogastricus]
MLLHKYCASGNDFLITHQFTPQDRSALAKEVCDRHYGFGADGLVVLLPHSEHAYTWEFYNADGSCASMCGNASRCVGLYAYHQGLASLKHTFLSGAGVISLEVLSLNPQGGIVQSNLGVPKRLESLQLEGQTWHLLDTGVPHLVHFVDHPNKIPTHKTPQMQALRTRFNANVNIACITDSHTIRLATYERGVEDITLACGTGMAAVFVAARKEHHLTPQATLIPPSGEALNWYLKGHEVCFKGQVHFIGFILEKPAFKGYRADLF